MKLILLTGLDGSGKSTLLSRLEAKADPDGSIGFLRVPKIEEQLYEGNGPLYRTSLFINRLHADADRLNVPSLKALALFSSMLLFRELLAWLHKNGRKLVFCERHPLIDTAVYARFYADKLDPSTMDPDLFAYLDATYPDEIHYLVRNIHVNQDGKGMSYGLLAYIHTWFAVHRKWGTSDLRLLFGVDLPDTIYYLYASPDILMQRISGREVREAHESKAVFAALLPVYEQVLAGCGVDVARIRADQSEQLDAAFQLLSETYLA